MVRLEPGTKLRGREKVARIPIKIVPTDTPLRKPEWIRIKIPTGSQIETLKNTLREHNLHTVCEEASCPNLAECFHQGTATFMIMGDICTRRCPFCDVAHGRPKPLDPEEPQRLAQTIAKMQLRYVVITSVDRDDVKDSGAGHFVACIQAIRQTTPSVQIEILVPDFRGRMDIALNALAAAPPDVFNHNLETVPRLYKAVRPGADYHWSLTLIQKFKGLFPHIPTKSGLMLGLGETKEELLEVLQDLRIYRCDRITLGQYLQPSKHHFAVQRYAHPDEFVALKNIAKTLGFSHIASGPMVRSSYHAEEQAAEHA